MWFPHPHEKSVETQTCVWLIFRGGARKMMIMLFIVHFQKQTELHSIRPCGYPRPGRSRSRGRRYVSVCVCSQVTRRYCTRRTASDIRRHDASSGGQGARVAEENIHSPQMSFGRISECRSAPVERELVGAFHVPKRRPVDGQRPRTGCGRELCGARGAQNEGR